MPSPLLAIFSISTVFSPCTQQGKGLQALFARHSLIDFLAVCMVYAGAMPSPLLAIFSISTVFSPCTQQRKAFKHCPQDTLSQASGSVHGLRRRHAQPTAGYLQHLHSDHPGTQQMTPQHS